MSDTQAIINPCLRCGACCASFRVSFYWRETSEGSTDGVPVELTDVVNHTYSCMKSHPDNRLRCIALEGEVGQTVSCRIYQQRSSTCRDFNFLDEQGQIDIRCNQARQKHGLPPLTLVALGLEPIMTA
ncbi:YkgJ family cysteine cluster protein [Agitococcus lubricus]|uniref:Uncharacterized protein n=1 Tax=Agitococcus lubricus TaxID=1077255 RepID=A0A2T5IZP5_9GAMM|nr:YkgJ family cysteine cluster protein [Agitococcus lubricus]PTQ89512.1 hypothetical protein C8N29_10643 [Agitococcus lubricus]